ncbi:RtcB family protein [Geminicoccaceae bacterium 1502E]|nr:RtcB family protein [Geminicoccaceae bacterium 1502E]
MTIDGRTLIDWGFRPGPFFKAALARANDMAEAGASPAEIRAAVAAMAPKRSKRKPGEAPGRPGVVGVPSAGTSVPLEVVGQHDPRTLAQLERCAAWGSVAGAAICADGHLGYAQPVGGVIAYERHVSVSGVGFDIGCGNMAVLTDVSLADLDLAARSLLADDIARNLSFGVGRANNERVEHPLFDDDEAWKEGDVLSLRQMAAAQLGTIGSGNHYVDIFADEADRVWIGVHFGSRGLGHRSATKYLKEAGGKDGIDVPPTVLDVASEIGRRYIAAMTLAGRYAYAGREWVVGKVLAMLGARAVDTVHNHHNYAWLEEHDGRDLWVVRKGATPAFPGQRGFVGGSMGDDAVILEGLESERSKGLLRSTVHGAGRLFGRREAKNRFTRAQMEDWLHRKSVILRGAGLDESPMAYRRLDDVLAEHEGTVRVLHRLRPLVVVMAGEGEVDPYKD